MPESTLIVEKIEHISTVILNRPERRNTFTPQLLTKLENTFKELRKDEDTRVVVLRGAGEKAFCTGFDLALDEEIDWEAVGNVLFPALSAVLSYPRPVISMIYGYALGGGLQLALNCDFRVAAENAKIGFTAVKMGVVDTYPCIQRFLDLLTVPNVQELLFLGRIYDALKAKEMGLVNYVVPEKDLHSVTYDLARELVENSPVSIMGHKFILAKLLEISQPSPELAKELNEISSKAIRSEDAREGPRAFKEKRKPKFPGK